MQKSEVVQKRKFGQQKEWKGSAYGDENKKTQCILQYLVRICTCFPAKTGLLYKDAPFVILDEPTAALDPVAEAEIYEQFGSLVGDKTSIYISHRMSSCKFCDKIVVLEAGKIAEAGCHEELMQKQGCYYELYEAQAQYYV